MMAVLCMPGIPLRGPAIPGLAPDALLATPGRRGVVVHHGRVEADLGQTIYLVRFEGEAGALSDLGPPVGCLPEELTQDEALARELVGD